MGRRDPAGDTQRQAAPVHSIAVTGIPSKKRFENTWQVFGGDAGTGICDFKFGGVRRPPKLDGHSSFGLVVLDGVIREVQQQLAQAVAVADHAHFLARRQADHDLPRASEAFGVEACFSDKLVQPHRFARELDLPHIGFGQQG